MQMIRRLRRYIASTLARAHMPRVFKEENKMSNEEKLKEAIWKKTEAEFPFTEVSRYMAAENWTWGVKESRHIPTPQERRAEPKSF